MSINSISSAGIENIYQSKSIAFGNKKKENDDTFMKYPTRALAYTNEVGVALQPAIGSAKALGFWAPALAYFGMDIADKYKKGVDGENPDRRTGLRRAILHAVASVVGPTLAIHAAQEGAMNFGGKHLIKSIYGKLSEKGSKLAENLEKIPFGKKLVTLFTNTESMPKVTPDTGIMKYINKIPIIGHDAIKEMEHLEHMGIKTKGAKNLTNAFKTIVGFAALAVAAIPIDMATEKILIEKVVNPALGLKGHDLHNEAPAAMKLQMPENLVTIQNKLK